MTHADTVSQLYTLFGRGDIPAILELIAEDVDWEYGGEANDVPWLIKREGKAGAEAFFQAVQHELEFTFFQPTHVFQSGELVIGVVDLRANVRRTGRSFEELDEVHVWRFDDQGKIARFRHRADTLLQWRAYHDS